MQVLLKGDVGSLGKRGDVVSVADGYARNYLVPRGLAVEATARGVKEFEMMRSREEKLEEVSRERVKEEVAKMSGASVTIRMRASEDGKLFGGVGPVEVASALRREGVETDEKAIRMEEHIRELGVFLVEVHIAPGANASVRVWVREE
jgi:large subunit ribosomal protein L9